MEEKMTVADVIRSTIETLKSINVPAEWTDRIGLPVFISIGNLKNCLKAFEENDRKEREQDEQRD